MSEDLLFDAEGEVDVDGMIECRDTRNVPPNPPPPATRDNWLDGKVLASVAVYACINSGSWLNAAVMQYLIDCANRKNGACYPSFETISKAVICSESTVKRAIRWWCRHGQRVNGQRMPFLRIVQRGRQKPDGTKESNAYHIGWLPLIAYAKQHHYRRRVRRHAAGIIGGSHRSDLAEAGGQICTKQVVRCDHLTTEWSDLHKAGGQM